MPSPLSRQRLNRRGLDGMLIKEIDLPLTAACSLLTLLALLSDHCRSFLDVLQPPSLCPIRIRSLAVLSTSSFTIFRFFRTARIALGRGPERRCQAAMPLPMGLGSQTPAQRLVICKMRQLKTSLRMRGKRRRGRNHRRLPQPSRRHRPVRSHQNAGSHYPRHILSIPFPCQ